MSRVLIVDDDENFSSALSTLIAKQGFTVDTVDSCEAARPKIESNVHDLLLIDMMLPDGNGLQLVNSAPDSHNGHFFVMTGFPSVESAVDALTGRAFDYLVKPVTPKKIKELIEKFGGEAAAPKTRDIQKEKEPSKLQKSRLQPLIGTSEVMQNLMQEVAQLAKTNASVLIQGESGSGKELIAQRIHDDSGRTGQLLALNCGAIPRELISSELFGHEKGSFTGAATQRKGVFESASSGTLFLDEVTEMPSDMQVHLLRVLETKSISRVGSNSEIPVDVRIVAATNRDPHKAVEDGKLREDLFFRLSEIPVKVPPLRDRGDDIVVLAQYFLKKLNAEYGTTKVLGASAKAMLLEHSWPGNIRELKNVVHRSFILSEKDLELTNIISSPTAPANNFQSSPDFVGKTVAEMEEHLILQTLAFTEDSKPEAARLLGISLKTLYNRLNQYDRPKHRKAAVSHT